jgi:hypothetical protein
VNLQLLRDPLVFHRVCWPDSTFYKEQVDIVRSCETDRETYVVAGNKLGKDYVAGFIPIWKFLKALMLGKTCKIITTSVKEEHLGVLWGEIGRWLITSRVPLLASKGGPLVLTDMEIRRAADLESGNKQPFNYVRGQVANNLDAMSGHHSDMSGFIGDEASGLPDGYYEKAQGWASWMLCFGNPWQCENFWRKGVRAGNLVA